MSAALLMMKSPSLSILDASNWEKFGANQSSYTFGNDGEGNLVMQSAAGTPGGFYGLALKVGVVPPVEDCVISMTIRQDTWATATEQTRCGIGARMEAGPDMIAFVLCRNVSDIFQIRGRDIDDGGNTVIGTTTNIGSGAGYLGVDYDLDLAISGLDLVGSVKRTGTADTPTTWTGTLSRNTGPGQVGIASGPILPGGTITLSRFEITAGAPPPAGYPYIHAETKQYVDRLGATVDAEKAALDVFVGRLKVAPLSLATFGTFWLGGPAPVAGMVPNLLSSANPLTVVGGVTHTPWVGLTGNGTTGKLMGEIPTAYAKATQDSACIGIYVEAEEVGSTKVLWGMNGGTIARMMIQPRSSFGNAVCQLNGAAKSGVAPVANRLGLTVVDRNGDQLKVYRNRTEVSTQTQASSPPSGQVTEITILADGTTFCAETVGYAFIAEHLTLAQEQALHDAIAELRLAMIPDPEDDGVYSLTDPRLHFAPVAQTSPVTHTLPTTYWRNDGASGRPAIFSTTADIIIAPNAATRTARAIIEGGRHVRWIGGRHVVTENAASSRALQGVNIANNGSIFVEGQYIDLTGTVEMDAMSFGGTLRFSTQTRFADVTIQNCKILGVHGTFDTLHADSYQHDYGIRNLRLDRVDMKSNYQNIFMRQLQQPDDNPIAGEVIMRRCFFDRSLTPAGDPTNTLSHLYFAIDSAELDALPTSRIELTDVWVKVNGADDPKLSIRPASASATGSDATSAYIHWPSRPTRFVDAYGNPARVRIGTPPGGGFSSAPGLAYVSPGYRP